MSMIPGDLVTDLDLLALDSSVMKDFGATSAALGQKRAIAVGDWLRRALENADLPPERHMTKRVPDVAISLRGGVLTALTALGGPGDLGLHSLLPGPSAALYIGMREPFRGLALAITDSPSTATAVASLTYWNGRWHTPSSFVDGTFANSATCAGGGRMTWALPDDWLPRAIDPAAPTSLAYWVRLSASASLTPALVQQILPLCRSRLTNPVACYTLHLIYAEGIGSSRGDWQAKSKLFEDAARQGLDSALLQVRDEFDLDSTEALVRTEVNSTTSHRDPFTWDRG
jgi:hypothetical protein